MASVDFYRDVTNIKSVDIISEGYKHPITILYGFYRMSHQIYLIWKTNFMNSHFQVLLRDVTKEYRSDYALYFKNSLYSMRVDLDDWIQKGLPEPHMKIHYEQFKNHIY
jgi:hypothetical protein